MTGDLGPLDTLRQREAYLRERIEAKKKIGWETAYDERERDALAWAIEWLEMLDAMEMERPS